MHKFITVTLGSGKKILVNPNQILRVVPHASGSGSHIIISDREDAVIEDIQIISGMIINAMAPL